ncbi:MAG: Gfo/Idh/MocA family oxidoreductase [Bacteroidaceae bacterium]|nr:Gfo/Idh/MocA family oxidoreductase [Bacteroidaceae bacterium]
MGTGKLRMGMIGGGGNAMIGPVHLRAALMENDIELVCGCFSRNYQTSLTTGQAWHVPEGRIYRDYKEMLEKEAALPKGERMDFVAIVTPNKVHYEQAALALDLGFDVVLDKPMTFSLEEALKLQEKVEKTGLTLALTHTYTGYPAVKEMKSRIAAGQLGKLRLVDVEYLQGWLSRRIELEGGNNAGWRTDPNQSGKGGCVGDIGTHAWHLSEYITGQQVTELCAELSAFVEGRPIDDDATALLHFAGGLHGVLHASQVATGQENGLAIRIAGELGSFEWHQMEPNTIIARWADRPAEIIRTGNGYMGSLAQWNTRVPGGHPEGYIEAFANIYRNFSKTLRAKAAGETPRPEYLDFPNVNDGVRGLQFIETMVTSGYSREGKWVKWIEE